MVVAPAPQDGVELLDHPWIADTSPNQVEQGLLRDVGKSSDFGKEVK
jgi:hypothetical protein